MTMLFYYKHDDFLQVYNWGMLMRKYILIVLIVAAALFFANLVGIVSIPWMDISYTPKKSFKKDLVHKSERAMEID